jgi:hypothetical protein
MKRQDTTKATSQTRRQKPSDKTDKNTLGKTVGNEPHLRDDSDQKIDRPGFDLGGSSGDTHAGTGQTASRAAARQQTHHSALGRSRAKTPDRTWRDPVG